MTSTGKEFDSIHPKRLLDRTPHTENIEMPNHSYFRLPHTTLLGSIMLPSMSPTDKGSLHIMSCTYLVFCCRNEASCKYSVEQRCSEAAACTKSCFMARIIPTIAASLLGQTSDQACRDTRNSFKKHGCFSWMLCPAR